MRRKRSAPHFAPIFLDVLKSNEWKNLTTSEQIIYVHIKARYNGTNNGRITLSYSELKNDLASATISKALKGLITKEWIVKTVQGGLYRYRCYYKLTLKYDRVFKT